MAQAVTCYPVYESDQHSNLYQDLIYCADFKGVTTSKELKRKGYTIHYKGSHYYNVETQTLVDFERQMQLEEAGLITLRTLAAPEEEEGWFESFRRLVKK